MKPKFLTNLHKNESLSNQFDPNLTLKKAQLAQRRLDSGSILRIENAKKIHFIIIP